MITVTDKEALIRKIDRLLLNGNDDGDASFFDKTCTLIAQCDSVNLAWIGLIDEKSGSITPVGQTGFIDDYLAPLNLETDDAKQRHFFLARAFKTKEPVVLRDLGSKPEADFLDSEARRLRYSSILSIPVLNNGSCLGVLNVYSRAADAFRPPDVDFFKDVSEHLAIGIKISKLEQDLKQKAAHMENVLESAVTALGTTLGKRDPYTANHQKKVCVLAHEIALRMGLDSEQVKTIRIAGALHDIGKVYVPAEILAKPSRLTASEFEIVKTHPQIGYEIVKPIDFPWNVAPVILQHHERLNGTGYPNSLSDGDILIESRILAIADVVEAMSSHRPYRPALGIDLALEEIKENMGILYDAEAAATCIKLFENNNFTM